MRALLLPSLVLVACAFAPASLAQLALAPDVEVAFRDTDVAADAGAEVEVEAVVTNTGLADGTVVLRASDLGAWVATVEPDEPFPLAAGASVHVRLVLQAPPEGEGPATRSVSLEATLTDAAGRAATAAATLGVQRVDPPVPAPPTPWYAQAPVLAGASILLAAATGASVIALRRRRAFEQAEAARREWVARETGIGLRLESGPHPHGIGREAAYRLRLTNESERPRVAIVDVVEVSERWRAAASLRRMPLSPGESITLTVLVRPDAAIPPGAPGTVTVAAKPEEATERDERVSLMVSAADYVLPTREAPPAATRTLKP